LKKLVCFGDSLTYGYGVRPGKVWHQILKDTLGIRVLNRGRNGDSLLGMQMRLSGDVLESLGDTCFFMAGTNDLMMGKPFEEVFDQVISIKEKISKSGIKTIILTPPPGIAEMAEISWDSYPDYNKFNKSIEELSHLYQKDNPKEFIDIYHGFMSLPNNERKSLYLDGVHLNEEGNAYLAKILIKNPIFRTL